MGEWNNDPVAAETQFGHISAWNTSSVTDMSGLFSGTAFNLNINGWDTSNVLAMSGMFSGAEEFDQPIGDWDVSKVTEMGGTWIYSPNRFPPPPP